MFRSDLFDWSSEPCDLLVVGGGATGLGVAVQAALEGRRVALVEARDYACGTSSRSTKLVHGGVRYLAQGRVKLVREALRERATLLKLAPHLAQPLPFLVAERGWLPWAVTGIGLKLYHWLAGRFSLGTTETLGGAALHRALPFLPDAVAGVRYWDGQFDDARLALALARSASAAGARLRNHTRVTGLVRGESGWQVTLQDAFTGKQAVLPARSIVNATGVWVDELRQMALGGLDRPVHALVRPSQGVHLVVAREKLPINEAVLVPHTSDGRVLFALPWLGATVIGTTDTPRDDVPLEPRPMPEELDFLFAETHRALGVQLNPADVKSVWVGLRPLVDAGQGSTAQMSREHLIVREAPGFLTVTGGKWTTYRAMAEAVMAELVQGSDLAAPERLAATEAHRLFGAPAAGMPPVSLRDAPGPHLLGTQAAMLGALPGADVALGLGLTESIVRYSARNEWAITVEDMLARRWRVLFLDARLAASMAPRVAEILHQETGIDPELAPFLDLCRRYCLDAPAGSAEDRP